MSKAQSLPPILPDDASARFFGRMTIIVASVLLAVNLWTLSYYAMAPIIRPLSERIVKPFIGFIEARRKEQIALLEKQKASAKTPAALAKVDKTLAALKKSPVPQFNTMNIGFSATDSPQVKLYGIIDAVAGLVLNTGMLLGAIGVVSLKPWGYRTTLWIVCIKLARIALYGILMMSWIMPIQLREMRDNLGGVLQGQAGMNPNALAAMFTSFVVLYGLLATIYPILLLMQLRKPRIKAACGIVPSVEAFGGELA